MTVLITGGAGFIGSHTARRLLREGRSVRVLDNIDPYYKVSIKHRNIEECHQIARDQGSSVTFEFLEGDFRDMETCVRATDGVDGILHLGALAGVRPSIQDPVRYMDVNVRGTQTLLRTLENRPEVKFVFASSSSVYGGNEKVPFAESDNVDHPVSPYAASKKAGEVVCYTHHHLYGTPMTCLRFFTVYGPGQRPEMAIHLFSRKLVNGETIPMFGDGTTRRDYTFVDDIVEGVIKSLDKADGYRIYNIGGSQTTELRELIAVLEEVFETKANIEQLPDQPGDVKQTWANTDLIAEELGFRPTTTVREGIERFREWYLRERAAGTID